MAKAEEQGSQVKQRMSEKEIPQVDLPLIRKKMLQWKTCEGEKVDGDSWYERKEKQRKDLF